MRILKEKKLAIILSVGLHIIVFGLLFIKLPHSQPKLAKNVNIIQAVAISESSTKAKEPSHVPALAENTIRRIEQTTLKQPDVPKIPIAKPIIPEETTPTKTMEPVKKIIQEPQPVELQQPKIDEQAKLLAKQKQAEEKKKADEKHQQEIKQHEAELAKQRRDEETDRLQKEVAAEAKTSPKEADVQEETASTEESDDSVKTEANEGDKESTKNVTASNTQGELDKYKQMIIKSISRKWILPEDVAEDLSCQLLVHLGPGGVVINVDVLKESGDTNLDRSARNAIMKASPLPVPETSDLFDNFRSLRLTFRPEGIVSG